MKGNVDTLVSNESPDHIILYISTNDVTLERNSEKDTILFLHFYKKLICAKSEVGISDVTPFFIQKNQFIGNAVLALLKIRYFWNCKNLRYLK